jgi:hypothetical protein
MAPADCHIERHSTAPLRRKTSRVRLPRAASTSGRELGTHLIPFTCKNLGRNFLLVLPCLGNGTEQLPCCPAILTLTTWTFVHEVVCNLKPSASFNKGAGALALCFAHLRCTTLLLGKLVADEMRCWFELSLRVSGEGGEVIK